MSESNVSEGSVSGGGRNEGSGTNDSEDDDFIVDLENQLDEVDVGVRDFHMHVDEDVEWILKTFKQASFSGIQLPNDEDFEVIDLDSFESPIVEEDDYRKRMLRNLSKVKACYQG